MLRVRRGGPRGLEPNGSCTSGAGNYLMTVRVWNTPAHAAVVDQCASFQVQPTWQITGGTTNS
jgi:hypothetical protein